MATHIDDVDRAWWKEAVVYQIYPKSFNDSDGDGFGDIPGLIERLDYVADLGVDVIWLNPVYESPQVDDGYDIADYRAIYEPYGTMADWERLLEEIHARDMRLIMDLVVNHTSDQHEWFQRSRNDEDGYREYYWWREGDPDERPNNWTTGFGGPAWTWDEDVGMHYLHLFDETQPDLNWENPEVRESVHDMMNWWLEKGIDGFRMDVINLVSKPDDLPDGDPDSDWVGTDVFANGPRLREYLDEMADATYRDRDTMTVGEFIAGLDPETASEYVGEDRALDMLIHFEHMLLDKQEGWWTLEDWDLVELKAVLAEWQEAFDGWNATYLGNHDQSRIVSRFGDDGEYRRESGKLLATLLMTHRGTPYVFQGDEFGMTNYPWSSLEEMHDASAVTRVESALESGRIDSFADAEAVVRYRSRDNARTPVQWDESEQAGFTTGEPWIPVNGNHDEINVAAAEADPDSILHFYRDLIEHRRSSDLLVYGDYELLLPEHETVYAYTRALDRDDGTERALIVLNFDDSTTTVTVPTTMADPALVVSNYEATDESALPELTDAMARDPAELELRPYEARVYRED